MFSMMLPAALVAIYVTYFYAEAMCRVSTKKGFGMGVAVAFAALALETLVLMSMFSMYSGMLMLEIVLSALSCLAVPQGSVLLLDALIRKRGAMSKAQRALSASALVLALVAFIAFGTKAIAPTAVALVVMAVAVVFLGLYAIWKGLGEHGGAWARIGSDRRADKMSRRAFFGLMGACCAGIFAQDPQGWIDRAERWASGVELEFDRDDSLGPLDSNGIAWKLQDGWIQLQLTAADIPGRKVVRAHLRTSRGSRHGSRQTTVMVYADPGEGSWGDFTRSAGTFSQWRLMGEDIRLTDSVEVEFSKDLRVTAKLVS